MGWFGNILGGGVKEAGEGLKAGLEGAGTLAEKLRSALTGDITADKKAEIMIMAEQLSSLIIKSTSDINLAEAQSGSNFRGGWRPAIGWVCAMALWSYYVPRLLLGALLWVIQSWNANALMPYPEMPIMDIIALVGTLLGSKVIRSNEKLHGKD